MLILTIVIGFAMMTLGVALLLVGEAPFIAGKRISARRSRLIGMVLVSFLPLSWGTLQGINSLFGPETVEGPVVTSFLFSFCCLITLAILFRVMVPKRAARKLPGAQLEPSPLGDATPAEEPSMDNAASWTEATPARKPAAKKSRRPAAEDSSPFDFN